MLILNFLLGKNIYEKGKNIEENGDIPMWKNKRKYSKIM